MQAPRRTAILALVTTLAALVAAAPANPGARAPLPVRLARALSAPGLDVRRTGALVVDLVSGKTVFALHPRLSLVPASNEKLPVSYAALVALGPSFRMRTEVLSEGRLVDRIVWRGNLVLKGYGDPTLSRAGLAELAVQLRALGIRRVTGAIVGDESYFDARRTAPGWKPSFFLEESPPLSALVVDRARFRGAVSRRPALAAALLFREALRKVGVRVRGPAKVARGGGLPLASVFSPPLAEILHTMDAESDNFTAELVLKELGAVLAGKGTSAAGAAVVRRVLGANGVSLGGVRIVDGSGLSSLDRLTPRALVAILEQAWRDRDVRPFFVGALAVAGRTGTLERRLERPPARGRVRAKTGYTRLASALSGYAGGRFAFAIVQNGRPVDVWSARAAQDRFVELLAAAA